MSDEFTLNYAASAVQHLGVGLYKQLPQAIAELITNSWDADSHNVSVHIDYSQKIITVSDDGNGMTFEELNSNFLTVAKNRRKTDKENGKSTGGRLVTGKKGLGKLALFGIANIIEVSSVKNGLINSFRMDYNQIQNTPDNSRYHPEILAIDTETSKKSGTTIIIKDITIQNITKLKVLHMSLAKRFNKFSKDDFLVTLTDEKDHKETLDETVFDWSIKPKNLQFTFCFPESFEEQQDLSKKNKNAINFLKKKGITGVIFVKETPLKGGETRGFSIISRGKLASESKIDQFNDRSNDLFNQYANGYFNIDCIDDSLDSDYISTDRQSILWNATTELQDIRSYLDEIIGLTQKIWRKERKKISKTKQKNLQNKIDSVKSVIESPKIYKKDKDTIDSLSKLFEKNHIPENVQKQALDKLAKETQTYSELNNVYKELIPKDFVIPDSVSSKIRRLYAEMNTAATSQDDPDRFILTQGLLLRALIESTSTTLLKNFMDEINSNSLALNKSEQPTTYKNKNQIDILPFRIKYIVMLNYLKFKGIISQRRINAYIDEFSQKAMVNKHLDLLMHDYKFWPSFRTLKNCWDTVAPHLMEALELLKTDE